MASSDGLKRNVWLMMVFAILAALVLISFYHHFEERASWTTTALHTLRDVGIALLVAGAVGLVFEALAHTHLVGRALSDIEMRLQDAERKQQLLLGDLETRVNRVGEEIVMASGMLRNATAVGITAVWRRRDPDFLRDLADAIEKAKGTVRVVGTSLSNLVGYVGGQSAVHKAVQARMKSDNPRDNFQILFANPDGPGLPARAKYEHHGQEYEQTETYRLTVRTITETLQLANSLVADKDVRDRKVQVRLYDDVPTCFLVITEDRLFVEHYLCSGQGGENLILGIKANTDLFRFYQKHFDALWSRAQAAEPGYRSPPPGEELRTAEASP
jgi:hypothetical protein